VGVVIGGAFGKIVSSLVADIIMPPVGVITGGVDFTSLKLIIKKGHDAIAATPTTAAVPKLDPVTINYGNFINNTVDFVIVAASIFLVIKLMNSAKRKPDAVAAAAPPPPPTKEEILLTEIRDELRSKAV